MSYQTRIKYTAAQRAEIWDRWQKGESLNAIGRAFDWPSSSIFGQLSPTGGIRPPERSRSRLALSLSEREEISRGIAGGLSSREIARQLGRCALTISREASRNEGRVSYRASEADQAAWDRNCRPKQYKPVCHLRLSRLVAIKLKLFWSPQQIAGWLKETYPGEEGYQVSHETIYRSLFVQAGEALKKELQQYLRSQRAIRRSHDASLKQEGLGQIKSMATIRERPVSVEDRAVPGHCEGFYRWDEQQLYHDPC